MKCLKEENEKISKTILLVFQKRCYPKISFITMATIFRKINGTANEHFENKFN